MIEIKTPAIFLSFDDKFIKEWFALLGSLRKFDMKVTFYVSVLYSKIDGRVEYKSITDDEWEMLNEIRVEGHTIGYHGFRHLNMKKVISESSRSEYVKEEINKGVEIFKRKGFNLRHFSYPHGVHDDVMDERLLRDFDTLRFIIGLTNEDDDIIYYNKTKLNRMRIFHSLCLENKTIEGNNKILSILKNLMKPDNKILFAHMHRPDNKIMRHLFSCQESGVNFYPMGIFENR